MEHYETLLIFINKNYYQIFLYNNSIYDFVKLTKNENILNIFYTFL